MRHRAGFCLENRSKLVRVVSQKKLVSDRHAQSRRQREDTCSDLGVCDVELNQQGGSGAGRGVQTGRD